MDSASDTIRISTTPTFDAYWHFMKWTTYRQMRRLIPFAILSLIAFALAPLFPVEQQGAIARYQAAVYLLFLPGFLFVVFPISNYVAAKKRWQRAVEIRAPRTYVFSDAGIEISSEPVHSQATWNVVVTANRHRNQILLGTAQKLYYLVPVNDFESPEQLDRFLKLVKSKVANCRL